MKRFLIVFVAVMLLVVTGCGNNTKKLECSAEEDGQKVSYDIEFNKEDVMTKQTIKMEVPYEEGATEEEKTSAKSYMSLMCSVYNYEGVNCEVKDNDDAIVLVVELDFEKMSDEDKSSMGYGETELTYEGIKKLAEEDGLTCK